MKSTSGDSSASTYYFSNVRAIAVLLLIFLHVALSYSPVSAKWWIVSDPQKTAVADALSGALDLALMPILSFIAGYFAYPSYRKENPLSFLLKKAKKLMVPWLFGVLFLNPALVNAIRLSRGGSLRDYAANALGYYLDFFRAPGGVLQDRSASPDFFSQYHLWFLSLLFYFFVCYLAYRVLREAMNSGSGEKPVRSGHFGAAVLALVFSSSLGYFALHELFGNGGGEIKSGR